MFLCISIDSGTKITTLVNLKIDLKVIKVVEYPYFKKKKHSDQTLLWTLKMNKMFHKIKNKCEAEDMTYEDAEMEI